LIFAGAFVAGMSILGYGFVAEYMNYTRARQTLWRTLTRERGIPPTQIDGGFELNSDTQVREAGYINNPLLRNPPGAYQETARGRFVDYSPEQTPVTDARYRLSILPVPDSPDLDPEPVLSVPYTSPVFPPHERRMFVYRVRR
jgi:hypothetical protein